MLPDEVKRFMTYSQEKSRFEALWTVIFLLGMYSSRISLYLGQIKIKCIFISVLFLQNGHAKSACGISCIPWFVSSVTKRPVLILTTKFCP